MSTTITIRPQGSIFFQSVGGSPSIGQLNDNNDGTHVDFFHEFQGEVSAVETEMGTFALAGNQRVSSARARSRIRMPVGSSAQNLNLFLQVVNQGNPFAEDTVASASTNNVAGNAFYDFATGFGATNPATGELVQWDIDNARVLANSTSGIGGSADWQVSEFYADFVVQTQPTVTVTSVTPVFSGTTTSSQTPTINWTQNLQGDTGSRYRVRVFTQAQTLIGGFNPDSSPSTYDSGNLAGAPTSHQITTIARGGPYFAYVKVATNFNGSDWFSTNSSFQFDVLNPVDMPGAGDLSASATTTAQAAASMPGVGDLQAAPTILNPCGVFGYAGGWYGEVDYGGSSLCDAREAAEVAPTPSNVLNPDDSAGRLGCGEPSFFITSRCAGAVTCVLDSFVTSATWNRRLDDVSQAEVTVELSGDAGLVCCQCLAETEPWCNELHIWRDGGEVWVGPIQEIEYSYNQVMIRASDSLAWLGVRIPLLDIAPVGPQDLTTLALGVLTQAYALDAPFTCELDNVFSEPSGTSLKLFYEHFNQTALEILRNISELGLNFTTLGRTIVLVGNQDPLTPLVLLNDEHIMGDIVITKDGTLQGNRFFVHFEGDGGVPVTGEATNFYCYSAIERIRDGDGLADGASAGVVADAYAAASAIAPRNVEIPAGSKLSPDTPWTLDQMVPGARVDVAVTRLCLDLTQSFILTEVEVSYSPGDGESVGISLTPINVSAVA